MNAAQARHFVRLTDVLLILLLALFIYKYVVDRPPPADSLMEVHQVAVADHYPGENPPVVYDRTIHRQFFARWVAKVYPVGTLTTVCTGSGSHDYDPEDQIVNVTLEWYLESECKLPPGQYYMKTAWATMLGTTIRHTTDVWTVLEP